MLVQAGSAVHAVTDVTGFSLPGHAWEMAAQSLTNMRFDFAALPFFPNVRHYAEAGCVPGGTERNERSLRTHVRFDSSLDRIDQTLLFDPQTSGGLLAAIDPTLWPSLSQNEETTFWHIGEVTDLASDEEHITLTISA